MDRKKRKKQPWGSLILGGFNFFVLGLLSLGIFLPVYFNPGSSASQALRGEFNKIISGGPLTTPQFKVIILSQAIIATIFLLSGLGILLRKEWGRRLTLYFSFFTVILTGVTALFNSLSINQAILQIIYPGILIFYFTNKKVESCFVAPQRPEERSQE
ncbi:MAG: hypothetical protein ABIE75_04715 [Candidatus Omnitrophota bacterium]